MRDKILLTLHPPQTKLYVMDVRIIVQCKKNKNKLIPENHNILNYKQKFDVVIYCLLAYIQDIDIIVKQQHTFFFQDISTSLTLRLLRIIQF